jgi:hypothetical protein
MAKGPQFKDWVTPVGMFKMTFLDKPSPPFEGKGDPMYKTRILLDDTAENREFVAKVIAKAEEEAKTHKVKLKKQYHNPFIMPEDMDDDDFVPEEGKTNPKYDEDHRDKIIFDIKSKYKPGLIDAARESLPEDVKIYGGDKGRVKFVASPFVSGANTGITLRLVTVQLVEKNANYGGNRGPNTDGFDDIDGYVAPAGSGEDDEEEDF